MIPAIVIGLIWSQIYDPNSGLLNGILTRLGLEQFTSFPGWRRAHGAVGRHVRHHLGLVGFYMVLFIAAIKGVPAEVFEARIDGAGRFRTAVSITIPLIRDNVQTAFIYIGILALDAFVYMAALELRRPVEHHAGHGPTALHDGVRQGQFGYACAMGVVLAGITLAYAGLVFAINRLTGGKSEVGE